MADRQAGRQADRQAGRQADNQTGRHAHIKTDKQALRQTDRQAGRQAYRQAVKQTNTLGQTETDKRRDERQRHSEERGASCTCPCHRKQLHVVGY